MIRCGKRVTLAVMAVGLAVVLVFAVAYRKPILEHVEAWHFQLTMETETIEPGKGRDIKWKVVDRNVLDRLFQVRLRPAALAVPAPPMAQQEVVELLARGVE